MKKQKNWQMKYKLSHDRIVEFRGLEDLVTLNKSQISISKMEKIKDYLQIYSDTVYIMGEDNKTLEGIMTVGDVKKSLLQKELSYNTNYKYISDEECISESFFEEFFYAHRSIRGLPLVIDKVLVGEFVLHIGGDSPLDKVQWKSFESGVVQFFNEHGWKNIHVPDIEETQELRAIISGIDTVQMSSIEDSDLIIEDASVSRERMLRMFITNDNEESLFYGKESIRLYNMYMRCMVKFIVDNLNRHNVRVFCFEAPRAEKIQGLTDEEKAFLKNSITIEDMILTCPHVLDLIYGESISKHYVCGSEFNSVAFVDRGQWYQLADFHGKYLNIIDGKRITVGTPETCETTVHVFGTCIARGHCVCDEETIESYLQKRFNQHGEKIKVVNYGLAGRLGNTNDFHYVMNTQIKENDIVIFLAEYEDFTLELFNECNVPIYETSSLFFGPHNYGRWFLDNMNHINHVANKLIADYVYEKIQVGIVKVKSEENPSFLLNEHPRGTFGIDEQRVKEYLKDVVIAACKRQSADLTKCVGAIVMNCNPFTNGHKYLIETSADKVDTLIVFVVEENRSMFSFEDRIELVRKGTAHLRNVVVVPSGNFIISATTFPEYFNKSQLQEVVIDFSKDVTVFAKSIAPKLNISVRFVGEEPMDKVTRAYNRKMEEILPMYGIKFVEIPRKMEGDKVISASYVRKLMEQKDNKKIKEIVPITTYEYLEQVWLK